MRAYTSGPAALPATRNGVPSGSIVPTSRTSHRCWPRPAAIPARPRRPPAASASVPAAPGIPQMMRLGTRRRSPAARSRPTPERSAARQERGRGPGWRAGPPPCPCAKRPTLPPRETIELRWAAHAHDHQGRLGRHRPADEIARAQPVLRIQTPPGHAGLIRWTIGHAPTGRGLPFHVHLADQLAHGFHLIARGEAAAVERARANPGPRRRPAPSARRCPPREPPHRLPATARPPVRGAPRARRQHDLEAHAADVLAPARRAPAVGPGLGVAGAGIDQRPPRPPAR